MTIKLVIDSRERKLIHELKKRGREFEITNLDIGDIIFKSDNKEILIIERKTVLDLKNSICDGRNREQKARLLHSGNSIHRIMYIIEGSLTNKIPGLPITTLMGSIINTQFRDGLQVYRTYSLYETALYIERLLDKFTKELNIFFKWKEKLMSPSIYSSTLKRQKKANMSSQTWFISQLTLIPQVTARIAEKIFLRYPSIAILCMKYQEVDENKRANLLADINTTLSNGKNRRIGNKISTRIYEYFFSLV